MRNLKITFSYDGSGFWGYQKQPTKRTVQGELEKALSLLLRDKISLLAAGRTDRGVHALEQVANFKTKSKMPLDKIVKQLNNVLDSDIETLDVEEVDIDFKAPWDASSRTYIYKIKDIKDKSLFNSRYYTFVENLPTSKELQGVMNSFVGEHDFVGFATKVEVGKPTIKYIDKVEVKMDHGLEITIKSKSFLRGMVRFMVGSSLAILDGKLPKNYIEDNLAYPLVHVKRYKSSAAGLYLAKVEY